MKISLKNNRLILENGKELYLTKDMINNFSLKDRTSLSDEELRALIKMRLKLTAFNMLSKKDYFSKEITEKLVEKIGFEKYAIEIVSELVESGIINDFEKAKDFIRSHINYGSKKKAFILKKMGVGDEVIFELLQENEEDEIQNITLILKNMQNKDRNKKISSLMNKGFKYSNIKKAIDMEETK